MKRFDIRKVRKLGASERYGEIYYYWREAELLSASDFPDMRRHGRRLKKRLERLYGEWAAFFRQNGIGPAADFGH